MAQFRTTADILDLALGSAGEVTNGNSPYETDVLNKLNRAYHNLISGGTIPLGKDHSVEIDENWPWAKAKSPLIIELQPAYTTGFINLNLASEAGTFTQAPVSSLAGYHLNINGRDEWFKITTHTAADTAVELDGLYPDESGTFAFSAVKLDYPLLPTLITVNSESNKIQFQKTAGSTLTGTLTSGTYALSDYISHVATVMTAAAGGPTITGSYSSITRKFTLTSDGAGSTTLLIVGNGTFSAQSAHKILGFDDETSSASLTQTSTYVFGGIARLVEPFRANKGSGDGIFGTDSESFHRNYPISLIEEGVPDRFCIIREDEDGALTVRFNRYVRAKTRVEIDYVPVPHDLKDNSSSIPAVPRKHIDILEDAACFYIMLLKSDDRAMTYAQLVQGKLAAMISQHRGGLLRTGENFGRIIPRRDMTNLRRSRIMSYPTPTATSTDSQTVQNLTTIVMGYSSFQIAATSRTVTARTLPANRTLFSLIIKHTIPFSGGSISALTFDVGIETDTDKFIATFDAFQAVSASAQDSAIVVYYPGVATAITVTANATGANLSELTAGSVTLYLQEAINT